MDEEFKMNLKRTLEEINTRLEAVEHIQNDVILGGFEDAANCLADDEAYSEFMDKYSDGFKEYEPSIKVFKGEDYDLGSDIYERIKERRDSEGFDEATEVNNLVEELKAYLEDKGSKFDEARKPNKVEETSDNFDDDKLIKLLKGE